MPNSTNSNCILLCSVERLGGEIVGIHPVRAPSAQAGDQDAPIMVGPRRLDRTRGPSLINARWLAPAALLDGFEAEKHSSYEGAAS